MVVASGAFIIGIVVLARAARVLVQKRRKVARRKMAK